jgi:hypothetical protein
MGINNAYQLLRLILSDRLLCFFINKNAIIKNLLISLIISTGICISIFISPATYSAQIIANANVTVLTQSQLRRIFSMRQRYWSDKQKIVVFVLPSAHPLHQRFSKKDLGIFPYKLDRIWAKLTYSGLGTAPIVVQSRQALINAVMSTAGAIGYAEDITEMKEIYVITIKD